MTKRKESPARRGRKPKSADEKLFQLSVRCVAADLEKLQKISDLLGSSLSQAFVYSVRVAYAHLTPAQLSAIEEMRRMRAETKEQP